MQPGGESPMNDPDPDSKARAGRAEDLHVLAGFAEVHRALVQAIDKPFGLREQLRYPRLSVGRFKRVRLLLRDQGDFDGDPLLADAELVWAAAVRAGRRGGELVALFDTDSQPGTLVRVAYLEAGEAVQRLAVRRRAAS